MREPKVGEGEGRSRDIWNVGEPNGRLGLSGGAVQERGWLGRVRRARRRRLLHLRNDEDNQATSFRFRACLDFKM